MKRILLALVISAVSVMPALAALKVGGMAPDFSAQASLAGKAFAYSLTDALKAGPVVVYFYPSAFSEGCNLEAHTFSVRKGEFDAAGATIIGVSLDSMTRLNAFSADPRYCAGKIAVASDVDGKIAKAYGLKMDSSAEPFKDTRGIVVDHAFAERVTFVVASDHKILATFGGDDSTAHVGAALEAVRQLAKTKAKSPTTRY